MGDYKVARTNGNLTEKAQSVKKEVISNEKPRIGKSKDETTKINTRAIPKQEIIFWMEMLPGPNL